MKIRKILAAAFIFVLLMTNPALVSGKEEIQSPDITFAGESQKQGLEGLTPLEIMSRCSATGLDCRIIPAPASLPEAGRAGFNAPLEFLTGLTQTLVTSGKRQYRAMESTDDLVAAAAARKQHLRALIEDNPGEVLRHAISADDRGKLPPKVQAYIEEHVEVEGELEILIEDHYEGSRLLHFLLPHGRHGERAGERLSLHFASEVPEHLHTGSWVRVRGVQVDNALALQSGYTSVETLAAALPNTFGEQNTAVILIAFQDRPNTTWITPVQVQKYMFDTTYAQSVTNFYQENSYRQTWLTGDVYGVYTIAVDSNDCNTSLMQIYGKQAATAQVGSAKMSTYSRFVIAFAGNSGCSAWWGLGTVGGNPSTCWINGSFTPGVVTHEMGHNFGLFHSHAYECGQAIIGTGCTNIEYGDMFDAMGINVSPPMHFNAVQKEQLGWLDYGSSPPITTANSSGIYTIDPYESLGVNPKAVRVKGALNDYYYVEYRQPLGAFDYSPVINNANVKNGVLIHLWQGGSRSGIYLLDMTPNTSSWYDPALDLNNSFTDPAAGITITPAWVGSTAGVSVTLGGGGPTCVRANPSISISPTQSQAVKAGSTVAYTLSVKNNDSNCAASNFNLQVTTPAGWTATFTSLILSLASGATGTATLNVTSPTSATNSSYPIGISATNAQVSTYTASASATYVVSNTSCVRANPSVSISPTQSQPVKAGSVVSYTLSVKNNDTNCSASNLSIQATVPAGWTGSFLNSTLSIASGSGATTTLNVTSPTSAINGSYPVATSVTNTSAINGSYPMNVNITNSQVSNYTASTSATYVVSNPTQGISVTTDKTSYALNQTATITVTVIINGVPVVGARAIITVKRPDGSTAGGMTPHTGTNGVVAAQFRPNQIGTYQVKAVVDKNGVILGSATTSFTVK